MKRDERREDVDNSLAGDHTWNVLDLVTMSDRDEGRVAPSSESWTRSTERLVLDPGLPAHARRDQALALRAQPRGHELALEGGTARSAARWPATGPGGHRQLTSETTALAHPTYAQGSQDQQPTN
jgi:hypothetical protein